MKVPASEISSIRKMLSEGNPDPGSWRYYTERLLMALDDVLDRIEEIKSYL